MRQRTETVMRRRNHRPRENALPRRPRRRSIAGMSGSISRPTATPYASCSTIPAVVWKDGPSSTMPLTIFGRTSTSNGCHRHRSLAGYSIPPRMPFTVDGQVKYTKDWNDILRYCHKTRQEVRAIHDKNIIRISSSSAAKASQMLLKLREAASSKK